MEEMEGMEFEEHLKKLTTLHQTPTEKLVLNVNLVIILYVSGVCSSYKSNYHCWV